ncbi:MAG: rhodanese-like domain-containing protein [Bacteroidetes bacterium]|nr:rhodanese-like domain-containing protein [Bacteroidota bacterium]
MKIKIALLFIVAVILASCGADKKSGASESSTESVLATISVDEFEKKLINSDVQLIDVRTSEEFSGGYLKGRLTLMLTQLILMLRLLHSIKINL